MLSNVTVDVFIAIDTIDIIVWTVGKISRIHLMVTFSAGETLPVITSRLGDLLLSLEHPTLAPRTDVHVTILALEDSHVSIVQIGSGENKNIKH